jgi:hypothetical protein
MLSGSSLKKIVHNKYVQGFLKSREECRRDNRGGFLIPSSSKITDTDYGRYSHLPVNWSISPITKDDLPEEFSSNAVKTVDMFRRKTVGLPYECMIYFDYVDGDIVSCNFSKKSFNKVQSIIYPYLLKDRSIASIHNHPISYGSPPSGRNFEMLGLEFEDFELISSKQELWILESREKIFSNDEINRIRSDIEEYYDLIYVDITSEYDEGYLIIDEMNKRYSDFLLNYLNNKFENIKLTRRYLDG